MPSPEHQDACLDLCLPSLFTAGGLCPGQAGPAGASTTPSGRCSAVSDPRSGQLHTVQPKPSPVRVHMGRLRPGLDTSGVGCGDPVRGTRWEDLRKREPAGSRWGDTGAIPVCGFPGHIDLKKRCTSGELRVEFYFGQSEDCGQGDGASESSERLLQRWVGWGEDGIHVILVKGECVLSSSDFCRRFLLVIGTGLF